MTNYKYKNANFENHTDEDIPKVAVLDMLFEGTVASGTPAVEFEITNIESSADSVDSIEELEVRDVEVEEVDDNKVLFVIRTPSTSITAPANSRDDDTRVCHEPEIPYHHYDIAVLN